jgi:branched-chain amino acid transport system ATP-binding protein
MLLQVANLTAGYGRKRVIHDVSLDVAEGEIVAVLGHNGAGKSTLLNAIFGTVRPATGRVLFRGKDVTGHKPSNNLREGIGYAPQGAEVFKTLSVSDNLMLGGFSIPDQNKMAENVKRVQELFPVLHARRNVRAGALSGGERQML